MSIIFIDQTSQYDHHQVFNAAMVEILMETFQSDNMICYGIRSSQASMYNIMAEAKRDEVDFISIKYPRTPKSLFLKAFVFPLKEGKRFINFKKIFKKYNKPKDIILLSITTYTSFYLFRWLASKSKAKILCVLHGDMDYLYKAEGRYQKMNAFIHRKILGFKEQSNFKYIVLNKITKPILLKDKLLLEKEIVDVLHPIVSEYDENPSLDFKTSINLGHIGSMELRRKNSHFLYRLAKSMKDIENVNFFTIGLITPDIIRHKNNFVTEICGNKSENEPFYLPRKDYVDHLLNLDYILFFYPKDEYVLRASGAVSDFINFLKPVIALRHPVFEFFQTTYGSIGYICDTLQDIEVLILDMVKNPKRYQEQRKHQIENIKKIKTDSSALELSKELSNTLSKKGWQDLFE